MGVEGRVDAFGAGLAEGGLQDRITRPPGDDLRREDVLQAVGDGQARAEAGVALEKR